MDEKEEEVKKIRAYAAKKFDFELIV